MTARQIRHGVIVSVSILVFAVRAMALFPDTVSVTDFGAKGDGKADDAKSIQNAIGACPPGGCVYLPSGTYRIGTPIRLKANMRFHGAHRENTTLRSDRPMSAAIIGADVKGVSIARLTVEGANVDPQSETNGGIVFSVSSPNGDVPLNLQIQCVRIRKFRSSGLSVSGTGDAVAMGITIRDCVFEDLGYHGVLAYHCRRVLIDNCVMARLGRSGTIFPRARDVTVRDCFVRTTGWHGIEVGDESQGFLIENNVVEDSGDHAGVLIEQGAWRGVIAHNRIVRPRFGGIQLNNKPGKAAVKEVRVVGNLVDMGKNTRNSALLVYGDTTFRVDDCRIEGNTLIGGRAGLEMHYARRCIIAGNLIRGAAEAGLDLIHHQQVLVDGNVIGGPGRYGIRVRPYAKVFTNTDLTITNNIIVNDRTDSQQGAGIALNHVVGVRLCTNRVAGYRIGMQTDTCKAIVATGNDLRGNVTATRLPKDSLPADNLEVHTRD